MVEMRKYKGILSRARVLSDVTLAWLEPEPERLDDGAEKCMTH